MTPSQSLKLKKKSSSWLSLFSDIRSEFSFKQPQQDEEEQEIYDLLPEDQERILLQELKAKVPNEVLAHINDDSLFLCLRARKYDVDRAAKSAEILHEWQLQYDIQNLDLAMIKRNFETMKILVPGCKDREGRMLIFVRLRYHNPAEFSALDMLQTVTFALLFALKEREVQMKGIAIVQDLGGVGFGNLDSRIPSRLYGALSGRLPCRLGDDSAELQKYIDSQQLLEEYGGTFQYDHQKWIQENITQSNQILES